MYEIVEKMDEKMYEDLIKQLKPVTSQFNIFQTSSGSSIFNQGSTNMLASTNGPYPSAIRPDAPHDQGLIRVTFRPTAGIPTTRDLLQEVFIQRTLEKTILTELYPRTAVSVVIKELSPIGGMACCAINAAYLALCDARVIMAFPIAAITSIVDRSDRYIIEPSHLQLKTAKSVFTFSYNVYGALLETLTEGEFSRKQYSRAKSSCKKAAQRIFKHYELLSVDWDK